MPGKSGLDVLTHVRGSARLSKTPVMILTGAAFTPDEEEVVSALRAYVFYKQESDLEEFGSYVSRLTGRLR